MNIYRFSLAFFIAIFFVLKAFPQEKKQNVYFLKDNGLYVDTKDSADFIRVVQEPDSGSKLYNVLEYYPNNNPKMVGKSSTVIPLNLEGSVINYYPDKKKKQIANYQKNHFTGPVYDYYPNGKLYREIVYQQYHHLGAASSTFLTADEVINLVNDSINTATVTDGNGHYRGYSNDFKYVTEDGDIKNGKRNGIWKGFSPEGKIIYIETYTDGKFTAGKRIGGNSDTLNYAIKEALPTYEGGDAGFGKYLAQTMRYPMAAKQQGLQGTVLISFLVDKTGAISDVNILKSLSPEIDLMVANTFKSAKKWQAAIQNGLATAVRGTTAITFMLRDQHFGNIIINEILYTSPKNP